MQNVRIDPVDTGIGDEVLDTLPEGVDIFCRQL